MQRLIGIFQRKSIYFGPHRHFRRERHKLFAVAAGEIGDRGRSTVLPRELNTGNDGMSLMWMPPQTTVPPLATACRARGTNSPTGAKMIAASSFTGGDSVRTAGPSGAETQSESLGCIIARPAEGVDFALLIFCHLGNDMGGGAETVDAQAVCRCRL